MLSQRSKAKITIKLKSIESETSRSSTIISIYDYNDHLVEMVTDDSFILSFQKCLVNKIPLKSNFELGLTELTDNHSITQKKARKSRQKLFAVIAISFVILFAAIMAINSSTPSKNSEEYDGTQQGLDLTPKEREAIQLVQNFQENDESGSTITESITTIIAVSYGSADIFNHPNTKFGWDALRSDQSPQVFDVYFDWSSNDGSKTFHFMVDFENNKIWPGDELSSEIINIVNSER